MPSKRCRTLAALLLLLALALSPGIVSADAGPYAGLPGGAGRTGSANLNITLPNGETVIGRATIWGIGYSSVDVNSPAGQALIAAGAAVSGNQVLISQTPGGAAAAYTGQSQGNVSTSWTPGSGGGPGTVNVVVNPSGNSRGSSNNNSGSGSSGNDSGGSSNSKSSSTGGNSSNGSSNSGGSGGRSSGGGSGGGGSPPANPKPTVRAELWYYTTQPTFTWTTQRRQTAYQLVILRQDNNAEVYNTGKVTDANKTFTLPTSTAPATPGPLWQSGSYRFKVRVRTWDQNGTVSPWSNPKTFNVLAFERPRLKTIVSPPAGQTPPDPENPASHILIPANQTAGELSRVKAGAKLTLVVDSVGPIDSIITAVFPYGTKTATLETPPAATQPLGSATNRWEISLWTDANLEATPDGTIIKMNLTATGAGRNTSLNAPPYAAGIAVTQGSIFEDWSVIKSGGD